VGHGPHGPHGSGAYELDPVITWLIKELRSLLSPFITLLFNKSLATGCFPKKYNNAIVFPLKKDNLDASQPKNFRPMSNLPDLSKLLEQDAQLSQRDRDAGCVIVFAKSRTLELGDIYLWT